MEFSVWFYLYALLSCTLLYFTGWTFLVLYRQKKAWRDFAARKKLRYHAKGIFDAPEVSGTLDGYTVSLFTGEYRRETDRSSRKMTAIEIHLSSIPPFDGGAASSGLVEIIRQMRFREEIKPSYAGWEDSYIALTDEKPAFEAYLTEARLEVLTGLMAIKNSWVILVFKGDTSLLRFDTPYPLDEPKKVDQLLSRMLKAAKVFELGEGESATLKRAAVSKRDEVSLAVSDEALNVSGLELDEDDV